MSGIIAPSGYVDLDNDCEYSIDLKSTRSRETVDPKEDLAFYFNTYISPKYGLGNLNVSNVASFMRDLDMNWSRLTPDLKDKVLDIMVDGIFQSGDYDFKSKLLQKIGATVSEATPENTESIPENNEPVPESKSAFGNKRHTFPKLLGLFILLAIIAFLMVSICEKPKSASTSGFRFY